MKIRRRHLVALAIIATFLTMAARPLDKPHPHPKPTPSPTLAATPVITPATTAIITPAPTATPTPIPVVTPVPPTATPTPTVSPYTFSDDFNTLNSSKWAFDTEWGCCGLSTESDLVSGSTVSVANGILTLRAERGTTPSGRPWRSGETATKSKFQQLYGVFTARMQYPKGQGLWPAFWLLQGDNTTGTRPELDVMEAYPFGDTSFRGGGPTQYAMTNHYRDATGMHAVTTWCKPGFDLTGAFHDFELEWRPNLLIARLDGKEMGRQTANVPAVPMFMVLDMVVGGWAGVSDATTPSPADLVVDWVRVLP